MDFVDASAYLRQLCRRPGVVRTGSLMRGSGNAMLKFLQFGALSLQKPFKRSRLSYLGGLSRAARQSASCTERPRNIDGPRQRADGVSGSS
jgi:hypothetical protein